MSYCRTALLLVDGARYDVLSKLIAGGRLPYLGRLHLRRAVTVFPSTTGPAYLPLLTGRFPGPLNIPGIRWLSKEVLARGLLHPHARRSYMGHEAIFFDRDIPVKTLFEHFHRPWAVFSLITKGLPRRGNRTRWSRRLVYPYSHFLHDWRPLDHIFARKLVQWASSDSDFLFAVFPSVDGFSHLYHPVHPKVLESYRNFDIALGAMWEALQRRGDLDRTLILVVSDHGLTPTHTHIDLAHFLQERFRCLYYPLVFKPGAASAEMVSGNGMSHIYLKNGTWRGRAFWEDIRGLRAVEDLLALGGVDFLACQDQGEAILVLGREGRARFLSEGDGIRYEFEGEDPLGIGKPGAFSLREALEHTYEGDHPDAPLQLLQLFLAERTGDIVVSARAGYDLRARWEFPEHRATHGALVRGQMIVPVLANASLPPEPLRTVDLFPWVLKLTGKVLGQLVLDKQERPLRDIYKTTVDGRGHTQAA